jgi:hypothetical protein
MGWKYVDTIRDAAVSPIKERVENIVSGDISKAAQKARRSYLEAATDGRATTTAESKANDDDKIDNR